MYLTGYIPVGHPEVTVTPTLIVTITTLTRIRTQTIIVSYKSDDLDHKIDAVIPISVPITTQTPTIITTVGVTPTLIPITIVGTTNKFLCLY